MRQIYYSGQRPDRRDAVKRSGKYGRTAGKNDPSGEDRRADVKSDVPVPVRRHIVQFYMRGSRKGKSFLGKKRDSRKARSFSGS
jgi:hypothetical protein